MSRLVDNLLLVCFALGRQLFEQDDSMRDSDAAFLESKLSTIFHSEILWQWIHINAQDTKKKLFCNVRFDKEIVLNIHPYMAKAHQFYWTH